MLMQHDVAIIGAGPYGLSLAAHLSAANVNCRIFGKPMRMWLTQVLRDSHLKSEGFASSLYEPSGRFTLKAFCAETGRPYADIGLPVPCTTFTDYGVAFQQRFVPHLDQREIVDLQRTNEGFTLRADDGEMIMARRVVAAVGIGSFSYMPAELTGLPPELVSHSSTHRTVGRLAGRNVVVIGAGASALDIAKEVLEVGASVRIVARRKVVEFHDPPRERSLIERIKVPMSGLGPGWKSRLCTDAPLLFHVLPESLRVRVVQRHLGPAPCWFTREAVEGKADILLERRLRDAASEGGRIRLGLTRADGTAEDLQTDHVIAATGYRVDLSRLSFLPQTLRDRIALADTSPALSRHFESSVPGLYFVGLAAANSFGPASRFAYGAKFTAPMLSAHLARTARRMAAAQESVVA